MKHTKNLLMAFTSSTIFLSGAAFCAPQSTTQASTPPAKASASASASASKGVTPHNHMRDSKGLYVTPKKSAKPASASASASEK